jgi:hypothetical protein
MLATATICTTLFASVAFGFGNGLANVVYDIREEERCRQARADLDAAAALKKTTGSTKIAKHLKVTQGLIAAICLMFPFVIAKLLNMP